MSESHEKPAPDRPKDGAPVERPAPGAKDARLDDAAGRGGGGLSPALESEGGGENRREQRRSDVERP